MNKPVPLIDETLGATGIPRGSQSAPGLVRREHMQLDKVETLDQIKQLSIWELMAFAHVITGPGGKCMCGVYDGTPMRCQQILAMHMPQPTVPESGFEVRLSPPNS